MQCLIHVITVYCFFRSHEHYDETRIRAFVCDITQENCFQPLKEIGFSDISSCQEEDSSSTTSCEVADFLSLIFVLSSISPGDNHTRAISNVAKVVKPGGVVFFRDYGRHDMAQLRFKGGKKIDENFYARRDGTRYVINCYYLLPITLYLS